MVSAIKNNFDKDFSLPDLNILSESCPKAFHIPLSLPLNLGDLQENSRVYKNLTFSKVTVPALGCLLEAIIPEKMLKSFTESLTEANKVQSNCKGIWTPEDYNLKHLKRKKEHMPNHLWEGYADPKYYERTAPFTFVLKKGMLPSEGIRAFFRGTTIASRPNIIHACQHRILLDLLGEEKFNLLYQQEEGYLKLSIINLTTESRAKDTIYCLHKNTNEALCENVGTYGKRPLQKGDFCSFKNLEFYSDKHPAEEDEIFVIYVDDNAEGKQLFLGSGFERALTEDEIYLWFIEKYNRERTVADHHFIQALTRQNREKYKKENNSFLQYKYTLPPQDLDNAKKFVKGFVPGSQVRLDPAFIYYIQNISLLNNTFLMQWMAYKIKSECQALEALLSLKS